MRTVVDCSECGGTHDACQSAALAEARALLEVASTWCTKTDVRESIRAFLAGEGHK